MNKVVVVTRREDFPVHFDGVEVVTAREYLTALRFVDTRNIRVFNLCRSYRYQSSGYYVSLLAQARGHSVVPSVTAIQDFKTQAVIRALSDDVDHLIQKSLARISGHEFVLSIYFGKNVAAQYNSLCRTFHNMFGAPLLRIFFTKNRRWQVQSVSPIPFKDIPEHHLPYVYEFAREYFATKRLSTGSRKPPPYSMAILVDPEDASPPSDERAIRMFTRAAQEKGMRTQLIHRDELARIADFDALFIRATTSVANFTYRFARKSAAEGIVVIDDPLSIVRCTNKVYLAELLARYRIPGPKTLVIHRENATEVATVLGLPCVLKVPDSSFSHGVVKICSLDELQDALKKFLVRSEFLVAQEFMPTEFDWRIGIIDRKPLFACKYFMADNHWQIYNWQAEHGNHDGESTTLPLSEAPPEVVAYAVKAASLIGDGFYGVDLKQYGKRICVIEVNDNPSVEYGVEDYILKDQLYADVMQVFVDRIRKKREQAVL